MFWRLHCSPRQPSPARPPTQPCLGLSPTQPGPRAPAAPDLCSSLGINSWYAGLMTEIDDDIKYGMVDAIT